MSHLCATDSNTITTVANTSHVHCVQDPENMCRFHGPENDAENDLVVQGPGFMCCLPAEDASQPQAPITPTKAATQALPEMLIGSSTMMTGTIFCLMQSLG